MEDGIFHFLNKMNFLQISYFYIDKNWVKTYTVVSCLTKWRKRI